MSDLTLSSAMDAFLAETDPADVFLPLAGGTMDADADIIFANTSKLSEGTIDAGTGGSGGIALICAVGYELKWEAGRLYVMGGNGDTIRVEQYGFTTAPTTTDDDTKGYIVGSRRILDNGSIYICTDATEDAAVWEMQTNGDLPEILTPSTALTISPPAGTYAVGYKHVYYITPSGAQDLNFSGISIPSDSGISLPKTLTDGNLYVVQIIWSGTIWMLVTVIGGGI